MPPIPCHIAHSTCERGPEGSGRHDRERPAMTTVQLPATARTATDSTRSLLVCGIGAAPLWAAVSLIQAATREGYDLTRHPLSALSNGPLGWIQTTNFLVCGVLTVAGSVGLRRTM